MINSILYGNYALGALSVFIGLPMFGADLLTSFFWGLLLLCAALQLHHTVVALADEVAAASGLVMEKDSRVAAAIVRGVAFTPGPGGAARRLVRRGEFDLFR